MNAILLNGFSICLGGVVGYFFKNHNSPKTSKAVITIMGLQIIVMGMKDALQYENGMLNIIYLVIGTVIGEFIDIDKRLRSIGFLLQNRLSKNNLNFVKGFITATLIFCIGSMAIIGSLKIALEGDSNIIYVKTILDGVMAMLLTSTYGLGVLFSALIVIIYQGGIFFLAGLLKTAANPYVLNQLSSIGGVLLLGLGVTLVFERDDIKISNMLPAMFLPVITAVIKNFLLIKSIKKGGISLLLY